MAEIAHTGPPTSRFSPSLTGMGHGEFQGSTWLVNTQYEAEEKLLRYNMHTSKSAKEWSSCGHPRLRRWHRARQTPGHTAGHQVLIVPGNLYHYTRGGTPGGGACLKAMRRSR